MSRVRSNWIVVALMIAATCLATGCHSRPAGERAVNRSFYYWRGTFVLTPQERIALTELDVHRLYVRLFDVSLDESSDVPKPVGIVSIAEQAPQNIQVVPTVFLTNQMVRTLDSVAADALAGNTLRKVRQMLPSLGGVPAGELQIDCDWTASTRARYFRLLRAVRRTMDAEGLNWILSATIRLHQVRDRQSTGVPPVDRGMLMVYNTGNPTDPSESNAIFDQSVIRSYLQGLSDYPRPLDVALPLFSWGVVFHQGEFFVLLNNLRRADLDRPEVDSLNDSWYGLNQDLYLNGNHLFAGDRIRLEEVDQSDCAAIASLISSQLPGDSLSVSLYHLDPSILSSHARTDLSVLYGALR